MVVVAVVQALLKEKPEFVPSMIIEEKYDLLRMSIRDISSHLTPSEN